MELCQWCFNPITEDGEANGWHDECIHKMADFMEMVQLGQEIENA